MKRVIAFLAAVGLVALLIPALLLYFYHNNVLNFLLEVIITETTGFKTEVESLHYEFPAIFTLHGVKMYNPPGYSPGVFAASPYFYIDLDLPDILQRKSFHIRLWRLIISELHVEKSPMGVSNGTLLKSIKKLGGAGKTITGRPKAGLDFMMDRLEVEILYITYRDRTGVLPKKLTRGLRLPASIYVHTTDFGDLVDKITDEVLERRKGPGKIVEMSPFFLESSLRRAAEGTEKVVKTTAELPPDFLKTTAQGARRRFREVTEITRDQLNEIMSFRPFPAGEKTKENSSETGSSSATTDAAAR